MDEDEFERIMSLPLKERIKALQKASERHCEEHRRNPELFKENYLWRDNSGRYRKYKVEGGTITFTDENGESITYG